MGAEVFTYLRWLPAQPRADAAQLSGRLSAGLGFTSPVPGFSRVTPASGCRAVPVLGWWQGGRLGDRLPRALCPRQVHPAVGSHSPKPCGVGGFLKGAKESSWVCPSPRRSGKGKLIAGEPGCSPRRAQPCHLSASGSAPFLFISELKRERDA